MLHLCMRLGQIANWVNDCVSRSKSGSQLQHVFLFDILLCGPSQQHACLHGIACSVIQQPLLMMTGSVCLWLYSQEANTNAGGCRLPMAVFPGGQRETTQRCYQPYLSTDVALLHVREQHLQVQCFKLI